MENVQTLENIGIIEEKNSYKFFQILYANYWCNSCGYEIYIRFEFANQFDQIKDETFKKEDLLIVTYHLVWNKEKGTNIKNGHGVKITMNKINHADNQKQKENVFILVNIFEIKCFSVYQINGLSIWYFCSIFYTWK